MLLPNPLALAAVKFVGYAAVGHQAKRRGTTRGNVWFFSRVRVVLGWVIGLALGVGLMRFADAWGESWGPICYAILTVPRFLVWAFLIRVWFKPVGGNPATFLWAGVGTAVSTVIDLVVLKLLADVPFFGVPFC